MNITHQQPAVLHRRARWAVAALFFTNGALFANVLPRYPQIKAELGLSDGVYGMSVAAFPLGALAAGLTAGVLVRRFRSARVAVAGTVLTAFGVLAAGSAPAPALFALALFLAGGMDALTDVAQNHHGLRVQRLYRRSILNSFHAVWSIGAVVGGLIAGAAAGLRLSLPVHLSISAAVFIAVSLTAYRFLLAGAEPEEASAAPTPVATTVALSGAGARRAGFFAVWGVLVTLVLIAASGAVVEDAGNSWASLYLSESLGAPITVAAFGYVGLVAAQFVGRLVGDRLVDRFGQRLIARLGGLLVTVGLGSALLWPTVPGTIAGFAAAGLGTATLVPAAMHAADEIPGLRAGTGLTLVSWLMRLGFLLSPPLIGLIAQASSLRLGLGVVVAAGLVVAIAAQVLSGTQTGHPETAPTQTPRPTPAPPRA